MTLVRAPGGVGGARCSVVPGLESDGSTFRYKGVIVDLVTDAGSRDANSGGGSGGLITRPLDVSAFLGKLFSATSQPEASAPALDPARPSTSGLG